MPSAKMASPDSGSTYTESSLCVRTIPGCDRLATSSGERALMARVPGTDSRDEWRLAMLRFLEVSLQGATGQGESSRLPGARPPADQPRPDGNHRAEARERSDRRELRRVLGDPWRNDRVLDRHLARDVTEQASSADDQDRIFLQQMHDDLGTDDDDGNADDKSEHDEREAAFRRCRNCHDVVEAHDQVGDDDGPDRAHQAVARLHLVIAVVFLGDQLDADPQQQCPAYELEVGINE